jgi:tRNA uridine 5-carboxymethylaminomethyl modification enzyme
MLYQSEARVAVERQPRLAVFMDTVVDLISSRSGCAVEGVITERGHGISAKTVILASGTFMEGKIFIGEYDARQGRLGEAAALGLGARLRERGMPAGRLKTGTPARIAGNAIDYEKLEKQDGEPPEAFSFNHDSGETLDRPGVPCWITYTNAATHDIIRSNIHRSPLYGGKIIGAGPRYCPSIEDKVMRFPDRERHHVFIEPESLAANEMYLNGLSSSLPEDVQEAFIRSIAGLEHARIVRPAYAVEYDYLDPLGLYSTLESKSLAGFFVAGQTNGSSGYEEAAAQGVMAGVNAALKMRGEPPLTLGRDEAYIGVLIDDLTTLGTKEPYRMFTSRAERRLALRHDTADSRLTPKGRAIRLVDDTRWERFQHKMRGLDTIRELLRARKLDADGGSAGKTLERALVDATITPEQAPSLLAKQAQSLSEEVALKETAFPAEWIIRAALDIKYAGYVEKEERVAERNAKMEAVKLRPDCDYRSITGLSSESREKLSIVRPLTLGQAARIPGVRQSDIALLMALTKKG